MALMGAKGASVANFELLDQYVLIHISLGHVREFSSRGHKEQQVKVPKRRGRRRNPVVLIWFQNEALTLMYG